MDEPPRSGSLRAVARSVAALGVSTAGTVWLMSVWDPQRVLAAAVWLVTGLVVVPLGFALALVAVAAVLSAILLLLATPAWLVGRPTGLGPVLAELWQLAGHVLPGYVRALRRVQRPMLWGTLCGFVLGVVLAVLAGRLLP